MPSFFVVISRRREFKKISPNFPYFLSEMAYFLSVFPYFLSFKFFQSLQGEILSVHGEKKKLCSEWFEHHYKCWDQSWVMATELCRRVVI